MRAEDGGVDLGRILCPGLGPRKAETPHKEMSGVSIEAGRGAEGPEGVVGSWAAAGVAGGAEAVGGSCSIANCSSWGSNRGAGGR